MNASRQSACPWIAPDHRQDLITSAYDLVAATGRAITSIGGSTIA